jgi:predicted DCC family thiol-disulfide oxidoreductase YuxK
VSDFAELNGRLLVIYDGYCGFCNSSIRWFLRRDTRNRLRFAPSNAPTVAGLLAAHQSSASQSAPIPDSILVVRDAGKFTQQIFENSDAVIVTLAELPSPWPAAGTLLRSIPRPLRDFAYRIIARWRYKIWGHYDTCPIPTAAERAHFL